MNIKKCKCGADISFILMASNRKMPVDAKPVNMVRFEPEIGAAGVGFMEKVYQPHWATCPLAKQFKKEKKGD
jgi:hypothetical protein